MQPHRLPILLLDDFPDCCEAVAAWLEIEGWASIQTASAPTALAIIGRQPLAAVIMEPYLRAGSAMHVAKAARASPLAAPLLIAMSAHGREGDQAAYEPTLFDFNLVKPVPLERLGQILASWR